MFRVFAYGSNLCLERLRARTPSARVIATGALDRHELRFHKRGYDDSAKADAFYTGNVGHSVLGAVYEVATAEKPVLDRCERGYDEKTVLVHVADGREIEALTYAAKTERIDAAMKPFHWYKRFCEVGARQHGLPEEYRRLIECVVAVEDSDRERHERESAVLASLALSERE